MVRHHDQDERETDGARHWDGVLSVLKMKFWKNSDADEAESITDTTKPTEVK